MGNDSAGLTEPDWLFNKVVTARATHFLNVALLNGKQAAGVGPIFVNPAQRRSVRFLPEEGAFENQFATGAATITFALPQCEGSDGFLLTEVCIHEAAYLTLSLPRT